jgi:2-oxoglutarate dehydrogenase E2 component (dihydrolipoamide succinyltransferase)
MTKALEIRAPAEQTEGTRSQVLRWLKQIGDTVAENEPLIEIETDKVTVEVASPGAGILREIVKGEQEEIAPGEVLGRIEVVGAAGATVDAGAGAASAVGATDAVGAGAGVDAGGAVGSLTGNGGPGAASGGGHVGHGHDAGQSSAEVGHVGGNAVRAGSGANGNGAANFAANRFSPAVRRLLTENALDPASLRGSGLGGRITVEDVLAAIAAGAGGSRVASSGGAAVAATLAGSGGVAPAFPDVAGPSRRVPHTAVRKRVAEHMVQSLLHTAPHVTTVFEADMIAVLAHRSKHREEFAKRGVPLTLTAYFLQATVDAIRAVPEANSRWTDSALEIFESMHIGVGTALAEGGLVVPVLRDVQSRDLFATAEGLNDLVTRAREGRLVPTDVRGGTFTISNHGVSGSLVATPIVINQPQAAILGIGKLEKRPVVIEEGGVDRVVIRPRCYVTLTIDHRVMDGHQANRFLETFVNRIAGWPA